MSIIRLFRRSPQPKRRPVRLRWDDRTAFSRVLSPHLLRDIGL
jgi:hypothetical protein